MNDPHPFYQVGNELLHNPEFSEDRGIFTFGGDFWASQWRDGWDTVFNLSYDNL